MSGLGDPDEQRQRPPRRPHRRRRPHPHPHPHRHRHQGAEPGVVRLLLRLHPASFRDRWGAALTVDATEAGPKAWPNLLANAVGMWLHPVVWPAESASQRRHRAAAMAVAVTLAVWIVGRAATTSDRLLTWHEHGIWNVADCAALMLLGVVLVLPLPRPAWGAVTTLLRRILRALAAPALLGVGALLYVRATHPAPSSPSHLAAAACYWLTLTLTALQVGRVVGTVSGSAVTPPSPARLRIGIAILAVGGALASWISVDSATTSLTSGSGFDGVSATAAGCLLALTCLFFSLLRDLDQC